MRGKRGADSDDDVITSTLSIQDKVVFLWPNFYSAYIKDSLFLKTVCLAEGQEDDKNWHPVNDPMICQVNDVQMLEFLFTLQYNRKNGGGCYDDFHERQICAQVSGRHCGASGKGLRSAERRGAASENFREISGDRGKGAGAGRAAYRNAGQRRWI